MKEVNTKKVVFWATLAVLGTVVVADVIGGQKICGAGNLICREKLQGTFVLLYSIPILFLFSVITNKMREEVFRAWWNFARWWVPMIIVLTFLLNNASGTGGGYLGMGQDFIFLIQSILYTILILGSLWKIIRTHLRLKQAGK